MNLDKLEWRVIGYDNQRQCDILLCSDPGGLPYGEYNGYRRDRMAKWMTYPRRPALGVQKMPNVREVYYNQRKV